MDTFRSEVSASSDALGSSRLGGGSSASLSLSLASSRASSRSDLVSAFELRFLERRAHAQKKRERERRRQESNQRLESAEDTRRVERDKARELRRREMQDWLPTPAALRQTALASRQRSRARMRELREWYPPPSSAADDEMLPVFADQPPRCRAGTRQRAEEVGEQERRELEASMRRRLAALKDKVAFLEAAALAPSAARIGRLEPLERPALSRAPPADGALLGARSLSALPDRRVLDALRSPQSLAARARVPTAGVARRARRRQLPGASRSAGSFALQLEREAQERDEAEARSFLAAHRRAARRERAAAALQAAWRGRLRRRAFLRWSRRRWARRRDVLGVWVMAHRVGRLAARSLLRSCLCRWRREVALLARLRELELGLFADAERQPASAALPRVVVNLALASDEWASDQGGDSDSHSDLDSEDEDPPPPPPPPPPPLLTASADGLLLGGLVNAAFAGVQQAEALDGAGRARLRRRRHAEARANVRRKIAQRVFLSWKRAHASRRRVALSAQLCLKRAARLFMASAAARGVWPQEKLLTVFDMWARYAAFSRCRRTGAPLPAFARPSAQWGVWLYNFQERQVRKVKAAARACVARQRRFLLRVRAFARARRAKRARLALASARASASLRRRVLREWRAAIADRAADKKRCRRALESLSAFAARERRLRPLKRALTESAVRCSARRAWRAWGGVHLRAVCKRAWNVARIEHLPEWRRRAMRTLLVWRWRPARRRLERGSSAEGVVAEEQEDSEDAEEGEFGRQLRVRRLVAAWRHSTRKRGLFRSLRLHCARLRRKRLLLAVLNAWKQQAWKLADDDDDDGGDGDGDGDSAGGGGAVAFLEDRLAVDPWDAYRELAPLLPMLFFGHYSDAAAIFGGVVPAGSSGSPAEPKAGEAAAAQRVYSAAEVRQFHRVLAIDSLAEVRNAALRCKHLVNAIDPATGDSALHAALQSEDRARRLEVLVLLLTEGAATLDRPNRHGLTPRQLAASDPDAQRLLAHGVYAFFEAAAAAEQAGRGDADAGADADADRADNVVLWRVVALMLGELRRGAREGADVRRDMWHSQLREERWLRQDVLRFPASSQFLPSVLRCRAFLDGMRKRVARPLWHALGAERVALQATGYSAAQYGELAPYARFLQSPLLDHEAAEAALIHSFVGVLFSLGFPLQEVQDEAFRLEDACAALEAELLATWEQLQSSERHLVATLPQLGAPTDGVKTAVPLLRYFKSKAAMEYAMKREMVMSTQAGPELRPGQAQAESPSESQRRPTMSGLARDRPPTDDELKDAVDLKALAQRKTRKLDKKLKALDDQLPAHESGWREALVADGRSVRGICAARIKLERSRLAKVSLLLKKEGLQVLLSRLDAAIACEARDQSRLAPADPSQSGQAREERADGAIAQSDVAQSKAQVGRLTSSDSASFPVVPSLEVKRRLTEQLEALSSAFQAVTGNAAASDEESGSPPTDSPVRAPAVGGNAAATLPRGLAAVLLANVPLLQKRLDSLLRDLFVTNLFRTCCCWLAENMALAADAEASEVRPTELHDGAVSPPPCRGTEVASSSTVAPNSALLAVDGSDQQGWAMQHAIRRRRASLTSTRRVLETFQRDDTSMDMLERDTDRMRDAYADSASLLFKEERAAIARAASAQRRAQERLGASKGVTNPLTGLPEEAPVHTVDPMAPIESSAAHKIKETARVQRNRKKEELRHAMVLRQLERMAVKVNRRSSVAAAARAEDSDDEAGEGVGEAEPMVLPSVHGDALPLGNFILRSLSEDASATGRSQWATDGEAALSSARQATDPSAIEAMWKRGAHGATTGSAVKGAAVNAGSLPAATASATHAPTPDPAKRVQSASRRPAESDPATRRIRNRRSSLHGAGMFLEVENLGGSLPAQIAERAMKRGVSERQFARVKCGLDGKSAHSSDAVGECAGEAEPSDDARTDELEAGGEAGTALFPTLEAFEAAGSVDCNDPIAIAEERDAGQGGETQDWRPDIVLSDLIAVEVVVGAAGRASERVDVDESPAVDSDDGQLVGDVGASSKDLDASSEDLDAFLASMRSSPLTVGASVPPALALPAGPVSDSTACEVDDPRLHRAADKPLIVWETQPNTSSLPQDHPMVVQRLPLSSPACPRHAIEHRRAFAVAESPSSPLTIGHAGSAQQPPGSPALSAAHALEQHEGDDNPAAPLSLHGKSLRVESRWSRAELLQRPRHPVVAMALTEPSAGSTNEGDGTSRDALSDSHSDERGVTVPAITVSVVARAAAPVSIDQLTRAGAGASFSAGEALAASPQTSEARHGPFFVLDSEGSTAAASQLPSLEIAGVNTRGGSSGGKGALPAAHKRAVGAKSVATTRARGAAAKKEELSRARAKRVGPQPSVSCGDLTLEGAHVGAASKPGGGAANPASAPLTKQQTESVWSEFAAAPLSDAMQNAYAELYPHTYARVRADGTAPPGLLPSASAPALQLAVAPAAAPRTQPSPLTALELDKKFWRAVEGYRAIGSSPMIPLDAATITRRRRDQAESIYASFLAADDVLPGRRQQLEWVAMYPEQVAAVRRRLHSAPLDLFDPLQQTAQLRITTALATAGAAIE